MEVGHIQGYLMVRQPCGILQPTPVIILLPYNLDQVAVEQMLRLLSTSGNWTINGNISAEPIHILGATGGVKLAYASNFEANGANIQLTLERTGSGWGGIGASGGNAFMVYSSDIGLRFGVTQSGGLLANGGTEFLTSARNLINIGTISSGAITSTGNSIFTGSSSSGNAFLIRRGSDNSGAFRVQNDGVVITEANYLYAASSGISLYVQNGLVARGNILNDTSGQPVKVADDFNVTGVYQANGTTFLDSSRNLTNIGTATLNGDLTVNNPTHNYVRIESTGSLEQMIRFKNGLTNYWYTGLRTSAGIASTADYHIYSAALGNDAAAVDTSGNIIAYNGFKVNTTQVVDSSTNIYSTGIINTNHIKDNGSSSGLRLGNFSTSNLDETGSSVVTFLRAGTFDDYIIKGSTSRGVFGRQFIGPHFSENHSWGVFSSGWDTHFQISGDDRTYMKPNVAIGATPSTTGPALDVYQTADRPGMTIRSSNPGNWAASLIVGSNDR
jgi:hypothetical protein